MPTPFQWNCIVLMCGIIALTNLIGLIRNLLTLRGNYRRMEIQEKHYTDENASLSMELQRLRHRNRDLELVARSRDNTLHQVLREQFDNGAMVITEDGTQMLPKGWRDKVFPKEKRNEEKDNKG